MPTRIEITTPSDREICVTRLFDAPPERVFDFHTKPEYVQGWLLGPPGWSMPICEIDLTIGGRYRYLWRSEEDGNEFGIEGEFREISRPDRLVHTESMDGTPGEALCTTSFVQSGTQTAFTLTMLFESRETRDRALQSGMTDGMAISYDRMEEAMRGRRQ